MWIKGHGFSMLICHNKGYEVILISGPAGFQHLMTTICYPSIFRNSPRGWGIVGTPEQGDLQRGRFSIHRNLRTRRSSTNLECGSPAQRIAPSKFPQFQSIHTELGYFYTELFWTGDSSAASASASGLHNLDSILYNSMDESLGDRNNNVIYNLVMIKRGSPR